MLQKLRFFSIFCWQKLIIVEIVQFFIRIPINSSSIRVKLTEDTQRGIQCFGLLEAVMDPIHPWIHYLSSYSKGIIGNAHKHASMKWAMVFLPLLSRSIISNHIVHKCHLQLDRGVSQGRWPLVQTIYPFETIARTNKQKHTIASLTLLIILAAKR